jgi:phytoene dehydrogenase-like protein
MTKTVIIIGAGMGGLTAALRLSRRGCRVIVIEASERLGGLAAGLSYGGLSFDAGPYLLLDRPGLEWAFRELGLDLAAEVPMRRVDDVYQVETEDGSIVRIHADVEQTAAGIDRAWPGGGRRYREFVARIAPIHERLRPLLTSSRHGPIALLGSRAWRDLPFLLRSLRSVLTSARLPPAVADAVAIWTHVAGQTTVAAPSPLAFVTAILHGAGSFVPVAGMGSIPLALARAATESGVEFRLGTKISAIRCHAGRTVGILTAAAEFIAGDAVVSNSNGVGTYLELVREDVPASARRRLESLPLQSPGVCAYLAVRRGRTAPYLRFRLPGKGELCRLLVTPSAVVDGLENDGWAPARLIAPMAYDEAQRLGSIGQKAYLERVLAEPWWREHVGEARVLDSRTPTDWGTACHLYRQSMNPVMTARLMRTGRLVHRSPFVERLYLCGSATHPGQWVSFCAISGILAAECVIEDLA